jgi:hypothetical protein
MTRNLIFLGLWVLFIGFLVAVGVAHLGVPSAIPQ